MKSFYLTIVALQPQKLDVFMAVHAFVKLAELRLLQVSSDPRSKSARHEAEKVCVCVLADFTRGARCV